MTKRICDRCEKEIPREAIFQTLHAGLFSEQQVPMLTTGVAWVGATATQRQYLPHGLTKVMELCSDCIGEVRNRVVLAADGK